jgi:hypothetical protein
MIGTGRPASDAGYKYSWHVEQMQIQFDVITLTSSMNTRINDLLLSGSLPIPCVLMATQVQTLPQPCPDVLQVQALRSFSRLRAILFSFNGTPCSYNSWAGGASFPNPYLNNNWDLAPWNWKACNSFVCPYGGNDESRSDNGPIEYFVQVGGFQPTVRPVVGVAETYFRLKQALDQGVRGNTNIGSLFSYCNHEFLMGQSFMKAGSGGNWSSLDLTHGETLVLNFKHLRQEMASWGQYDGQIEEIPNAAPVLTELHIVYLADAVVSVGAAGTEIQY